MATDIALESWAKQGIQAYGNTVDRAEASAQLDDQAGRDAEADLLDPGPIRRLVERRRPRPVDQSPLEVLLQMPALVVLERLAEPALAVDTEGIILFTNGAFCDMLGHAPDELSAMKFLDIFCSLPTLHCRVALIRANHDLLVELAHKDGHPVWARMSNSALRRRDETFALVTFHDHTEELWHRL